MNYFCAYYWQQEESNVSLVLKQLVLHDGEIPVVFGCLAQDREEERQSANYFIEVVTEWFHAEGLGLARKGESGISGVENSLLRLIYGIPWCLEAAAVLLCVGKHFVLWGKGSQSIGLLNSRFGKPHYRSLLSESMGEGWGIISGTLEPGVGILIMGAGFQRSLSNEIILNCLDIKELVQERRVQKRLKELGDEAARKGEKHLGAMLIVTC